MKHKSSAREIEKREDRGFRKPMSIVAVLAIALTALIAGSWSGPAEAREYAAKLHKVQGDVEVSRRQVSMPGQKGLTLYSGDQVKTSRGRATVLFNDGSVIRLRNNTEIEIKQPKGAFWRSVKVFGGRLWAKVRRSEKVKTEFQSGTVITAIRGTILEYFFDPVTGELKVGCLSGSIIVRYEVAGQTYEVSVAAGEMVTFGDNGLPTVEPFTPGDIAGTVVETEEEAIEFKEGEDTPLQDQESGRRGSEVSSPNPQD
ncbi:FecR domain-containing protein [Acidobacteriota bacterium]